jgi:hypothetical protein
LQYSYQFLDEIDAVAGKFIDELVRDNPFRRTRKEFEWIQKFPWVSSTKDSRIEYSRYYFSQYTPDFNQWFVRINDASDQIAGFMVLTRHKNELKTPYIIARKELFRDIFQFICKLMITEKIPTLVTHNSNLLEHVYNSSRNFLLIRPSQYGFISTKVLTNLMKNDFGKLYDGDGDGAFT